MTLWNNKILYFNVYTLLRSLDNEGGGVTASPPHAGAGGERGLGGDGTKLENKSYSSYLLIFVCSR